MDTALIDNIVQEAMARFQEVSHQETVLVLAKEKDVDLVCLRKRLPTTTKLVYLEQVVGDTGFLAEKGYDKMVLPYLSCSDMADLAMGKASGDVTCIILSLLLNGQCVEVLDYEYQSFRNSAPGNLWALYESYEKTLVGFGLVHSAPVISTSIAVRKRLITEQDVTDIVALGAKKMRVPLGTVVTPLALDAAKSHKIQIIKK